MTSAIGIATADVQFNRAIMDIMILTNCFCNERMKENSVLGPVSTRDNRVLKGPLGRSLRSFARTAHSAHSIRGAPLRCARFARSLHSRARSLRSLPHGTVEIHETVFTL